MVNILKVIKFELNRFCFSGSIVSICICLLLSIAFIIMGGVSKEQFTKNTVEPFKLFEKESLENKKTVKQYNTIGVRILKDISLANAFFDLKAFSRETKATINTSTNIPIVDDKHRELELNQYLSDYRDIILLVTLLFASLAGYTVWTHEKNGLFPVFGRLGIFLCLVFIIYMVPTILLLIWGIGIDVLINILIYTMYVLTISSIFFLSSYQIKIHFKLKGVITFLFCMIIILPFIIDYSIVYSQNSLPSPETQNIENFRVLMKYNQIIKSKKQELKDNKIEQDKAIQKIVKEFVFNIVKDIQDRKKRFLQRKYKTDISCSNIAILSPLSYFSILKKTIAGQDNYSFSKHILDTEKKLWRTFYNHTYVNKRTESYDLLKGDNVFVPESKLPDNIVSSGIIYFAVLIILCVLTLRQIRKENKPPSKFSKEVIKKSSEVIGATQDNIERDQKFSWSRIKPDIIDSVFDYIAAEDNYSGIKSDYGHYWPGRVSFADVYSMDSNFCKYSVLKYLKLAGFENLIKTPINSIVDQYKYDLVYLASSLSFKNREYLVINEIFSKYSDEVVILFFIMIDEAIKDGKNVLYLSTRKPRRVKEDSPYVHSDSGLNEKISVGYEVIRNMLYRVKT